MKETEVVMTQGREPRNVGILSELEKAVNQVASSGPRKKHSPADTFV